jgi:hypothetical protein
VRIKKENNKKGFNLNDGIDSYENAVVEKIRSENYEIKKKGPSYKNNKYSQMFENLSNIIS